MKLAKKLFGIAVIIAVIGFMVLPLTGCPEDGGGGGGGGNETETQITVYYPGDTGDIGDSIEAFAAWLAEQPEGALCDVKLTLNALGGNYSTEGSLGFVLKNNPKIKVKLDLSDSTFPSIEMWAFRDCTSLVGITIPNSVTYIGYLAFQGCTSLTGITVSNDNPSYTSVDGILYNKEITRLIFIPKVKTEVTIPNSVTDIEGNAFEDCTNLTSITIPDSVTSIGGNAFYNCTSLTSVTIGNSVNNIESGAFRGCTSLTSVTIPDSVTTIGSQAFYNCTSLTSVTIPDGVTEIGALAFYGCTSLTGITVSNGNPNYASVDGILYDKAITQFIFIPKVKTEITIPDTVTDFGILFQNNTDIVSVTIGSGVTNIGVSAFANCTSLTSVTIGSGVTSIEGSAFNGCTSLTSITIPNSVTNIWYNAFTDCTSLTSATIGSGITSIGDTSTGAHKNFFGCTSLTNLTIGSGVNGIRYDSLLECTSLTSITVSNDNPNYASVDGIVYNKAITQIILVPRKITGNITIPNSVTSSGSSFYGCTSLTGITIPDSVTSIESAAFTGCTSLTSIRFERVGYTFSTDNDYASFIDLANTTSLQTAYTTGGIGTYTRPDTTSTTWTKISD